MSPPVLSVAAATKRWKRPPCRTHRSGMPARGCLVTYTCPEVWTTMSGWESGSLPHPTVSITVAGLSKCTIQYAADHSASVGIRGTPQRPEFRGTARRPQSARGFLRGERMGEPPPWVSFQLMTPAARGYSGSLSVTCEGRCSWQLSSLLRRGLLPT